MSLSAHDGLIGILLVLGVGVGFVGLILGFLSAGPKK